MRNMVSSAFKCRLVLPIVAIMLFAACTEPLAPEEAVRQRAQAWMDALLASDLEGAYAYTSPSYRQLANVGRYHARVQGSGRWITGEVSNVVCQEHVCQVRVTIEYEIKRMGIRNRKPMDYKWIEADGEWWLYVP